MNDNFVNKYKPKVVFTFVESGMGHIMPMSGIYKAFTDKYGDKCEIIGTYIFSESKSKDVKSMGERLKNHTKQLSSFWLYNRMEALSYKFSSKFTLKMLDNYFKKERAAFFDEYKDLKPDLFVSTYYMPSHLARQLNDKKLWNTLIATYTPDAYVYPAWDRNCDIYITNNKKARDVAIKRGFNKDKVKVVPFVFKDGVKKEERSKSELRKLLGLKDIYTVLYANGAYGSGGMRKLIKKVMKADLNCNFIVACGSNDTLKAKIEKAVKDFNGKTRFYALGFTKELQTYMCASDLAIGKASPSTVMEAIFADVPMITNAAVNRLEEYYLEFCRENKMTVCEKKGNKIIDYIKKDIENSGYIKSLLCDFAPLQDTSGAEKVADMLYGLLKKKFSDI